MDSAVTSSFKFTIFTKEFDNNIRNQPSFRFGVADRTVAQIDDAENRAAQLQHNRCYVIINRKWSNEEKLWIVQIDREERCKCKNFMKRI